MVTFPTELDMRPYMHDSLDEYVFHSSYPRFPHA